MLTGSGATRKADERTRTAYSCSLRVITQELQECAGDCKCRIFRGVSFPCLAACCTVLRSRWYQIGIRTSDSYRRTAGSMAHSFLRGLPSDLDPVRQGPMARNVKDTSLTETLGFCR